VTVGWEFNVELAALTYKKLMRHLNKNAGTIACVRLATAGTAMRHALEHSESVLHSLMRFPTLDVGDEPYTARILLEGWMIKPLLGQLVSVIHLII
jgi:hypothetical protein